MDQTAVSAFERHAARALRRGCGNEGSRRSAVRAWCDGDALLVIARGALARCGGDGASRTARLAQLQHEVADEVYLHTGELLRLCGRSASPRQDLLVLAFERVPADTLDASRGSREPLHEPR